LFNAMTLHGTSHPGSRRRISCDIRFFPLCGFLPSEVYLLDPHPIRRIAESLQDQLPVTVQAPLLEDLAYLCGMGKNASLPIFPAQKHSVLNWVNYISLKTFGKMNEASEALSNFVNTESGIDPASVYLDKFHSHPVQWETVQKVATEIESTSKGWSNELNELVRHLW
jgi:hypothetical protein